MVTGSGEQQVTKRVAENGERRAGCDEWGAASRMRELSVQSSIMSSTSTAAVTKCQHRRDRATTMEYSYNKTRTYSNNNNSIGGEGNGKW